MDNVKDMSDMFLAVSNFNADISEWKVNKVDSINRMFYNATAFDQDLEDWKEHFTLDSSTGRTTGLAKTDAFLNSKLGKNGNEPSWY